MEENANILKKILKEDGIECEVGYDYEKFIVLLQYADDYYDAYFIAREFRCSIDERVEIIFSTPLTI